jgi:glycine/D-amino acid oxidase-like deaminating enzyme
MKTNLNPYWWLEAPPLELEPTTPVTQADVVIIGGGYTGFGAAIPLIRAGLTVVVVEKGLFGEGASTRNGGITSGNLRLSLSGLTNRFGVDKARAFLTEGSDAREDLYSFIQDENIECDFKLTGRLTGAVNTASLESMKRESESLNLLLGVEAQVVNKSDLKDYIDSDKYCGGLLRPDIGGIHPAKLLHQMISIAQVNGVHLLPMTAVESVTKQNSRIPGFIVKTTKGSITAGHVIAATNGYTDKGLPWLRRRLIPIVSEMIATAEISENLVKNLMPKSNMFGEALELGFYYRASPDGKRILLGGRRLSKNTTVSRQRLQEGLTTILPQLKETLIENHWCGFVAFPFDQLPKLSVNEGVIYPTGFCGSGTIWARWLGKKAAMMVLGDLNDSVFSSVPFRTMPFYTGEPWFIPLAMSYYSIRDKLIQKNKP